MFYQTQANIEWVGSLIITVSNFPSKTDHVMYSAASATACLQTSWIRTMALTNIARETVAAATLQPAALKAENRSFHANERFCWAPVWNLNWRMEMKASGLKSDRCVPKKTAYRSGVGCFSSCTAPRASHVTGAVEEEAVRPSLQSAGLDCGGSWWTGSGNEWWAVEKENEFAFSWILILRSLVCLS